MSAEILKKYLMERLEYDYVDSLWITLTKQELLSMSSEELDLVKNFVKECHRGRYRVRPMSFEHFLSDQKYEEDCKVSAWIPLDELIARDILTVSEEDGKAYWYLYGRKSIRRPTIGCT
ncbi:MAG: hypothetical protein QXF46_08900 [Thermofilaceae archaeon]